MSRLIQNLIIILVVLLALSFVFSFITNPFKKTQEVSFSDLAEKIKKGEVNEIKVNDNELTVTARDGALFKTEKETGVSLLESLKNYGVSTEQIAKINLQIKSSSNVGLIFGILLNLLPFAFLLIIFWLFFRQAQKGASQIFSFGQSNIRLFNPFAKEKVVFKDVAGLVEAKQELEEVVDFLQNPEKFSRIGARIPRGALLMGPPGTGKTLLARAVAGEANVPFFHISGSEFVEMFVGVGASRVRDAFRLAKKSAPSILFIDEIDAVGRERGAGLGGGHDEREQTLNQILVEMDGFEREARVIIMAATNRPDVLDPALLRPGRFDRRIILDLPNLHERKQILELHLKDKKFKNLNLQRVAERTPGFSGADLANLINEAAILAARRNRETISQRELSESIEKVMLGPERKSKVMSKKEKEIAAYHEAGHALVAASLPHIDPVQKVTIIPRGRAGGYTMIFPTEEKSFRSRKELVEQLSVMLGGYAAEKIVFRDITTGGADDLKKASELSRLLITKFGMSEKIGPITFGKTEELVFLGREIATEKNYSEQTAALIDREVKELIKAALKTSLEIVKNKRARLDAVAQKLIKKETIEKNEFERLMKT